MDLPVPTERGVQLEEFQRKHRSGVVTLVFTDMADSTALKQQWGDRRSAALFQEHHRLIRETLARFQGAEIETAGDSFLIIFATPSDAIQFALQIRAALVKLSAAHEVTLLDRVGIHLGEVMLGVKEQKDATRDLYGIQIDTCARVMSLAKAGQILMTRAVFDSARQVLKGEDLPGVGPLQWLNHGLYLLKGLDEPVEICEVREQWQETPSPPPNSEKAQRQVCADEEPVLGWRPAVGQSVPDTRWRLEKKLGEGGFGEVWLGRNPTTREQRVFKFCFQAEQVRFLKRELTIFRVLKERVGDHPNIVRLHDVYLDQPPFYVEMDYVEGRDLRTWCQEHGGVGGVPLEARLEIVAQAAEGLQAAHDAGVIHRDIKPANILIAERSPRDDKSGRPNLEVKLTDFGIGQIVSEEYLSGITRAGFTQTMLSDSSTSHSGTHLYMAPELLSGKPASTRSDVYSLGVVLYQFLVGDLGRPLTPDWEEEVTDPLLRADLKRCFATNPQARFESAGQLARNLRALPGRRAEQERQRAELAAKERAAYRRGVVRTASLAALVIVAVLILALYALRQSRLAARESQRANENSMLLKIQRAEDFFSHDNSSAALAHLAQVLRMNPANRLAAQRLLAALTQRNFPLPQAPPLRHQKAVRFAEFSPDGERIVTASDDGTARTWDGRTGQPVSPAVPHSDAVETARFSPDGQRVVSGSRDHTARLWDAQTGRELVPPLRHQDGVMSARFSPDGLTIAIAARYDWVHLWDAITGRRLRERLPHGNGVSWAQFSPDGRWLGTGWAGNFGRVFDAKSGELVTEQLKHTGWIRSIQFSPDGTRVATTSMDGTARLWDTRTWQPLSPSLQHDTYVAVSEFSPDGGRLVTQSRDNTARVWDAFTGQPLTHPFQYERGVPPLLGRADIPFTADGQSILAAGWDNTARLWDTQTGLPVTEPLRHARELNSAADLSRDSQRVVTACADATARLWDVRPGEMLTQPLEHNDEVNAARFSPDGQLVATASDDRTAWIWDHRTGLPVTGPLQHDDYVVDLQWSPDGQRIATASYDRTARVWDARTGQPVIDWLRHDDRVRSVCFSPDGRRVLTASDDGTARIWDAQSGQAVADVLRHASNVVSATFSPNGQWIVTASLDKSARVWDARTGLPTTKPLAHDAEVLAADFSPDSTRIITAGADGAARIFDARTGEPLVQPMKHEAGVLTAQFSPDGTLAVTASADRTARLWNVRTGHATTESLQHKDTVTRARFSPDGRLVVTASADRIARVWDAQTGQPTTEVLKHRAAINCAQFSPDNHFVVTASIDHSARVWELPEVTAPAPEWLPRLAEALAGQRLGAQDAPEPVDNEEVLRIRSQLLGSGATDRYTRWAKWFFADRSTRRISLESSVTVPDYVQRRVAPPVHYSFAVSEADYIPGYIRDQARRNKLARLHEAVRFIPTNHLALARLSRLAASLESLNAREAAEANWYIQRAFEIAPEDPEVLWSRADVHARTVGLAEALVQIGETIRHWPDVPEAWGVQGAVLQKMSRLDEAYQSYTRAIELAERTGAAAKDYRSEVLLRRYDLWRLQRRPNEAKADLRAAKRELLSYVTIPPRTSTTSFRPIDLSPYFDVGLTENRFWWPLARPAKKNDFGGLPRGTHKLMGVDFDLRGWILLQPFAIANSERARDELRGISVAQKCSRLHFLHASGGVRRAYAQVGEYVVHYQNGQQEKIPLIYGKDLGDVGGSLDQLHFKDTPPPSFQVAWTGASDFDRSFYRSHRRLFKLTWINPHPDWEVKAIDATTGPAGEIYLFAITAE